MKKDSLERGIKKRKFFIKLSIFIIVVSGIVTFILKSDYFNVNNIIVKDNNYVQTKEILSMVNLSGRNIFRISGREVEKELLNNPYIEGIRLRKKLPDTIEIDIKEKEIMGLVKFNNGYINIDSEGRMIQIVNQFPGKGLPLVEGIKIEQYVPNESLIIKDDIKLNALKECLKASNIKEFKNRIYSINIADEYNIKFDTNDGIEIRAGDWTNLDYKLSYAFTIMNSSAVKGSRGYIEVQQEGSAIFKKSEQEVKK